MVWGGGVEKPLALAGFEGKRLEWDSQSKLFGKGEGDSFSFKAHRNVNGTWGQSQLRKFYRAFGILEAKSSCCKLAR